ncbi:MAG: hypothetical protein JOZ02_15615 [Acidobacteria bacterium]|nr:hypothetical protein [Acidobacteriota bacterium]
MSEQLNDSQTLTRYLLGALPAAETERLDELSVTDDELAEALRSAENDLIDAYVQDDLDGAALAQFKTHYLASAQRRERVAFAQAFQAHAERSLTLAQTEIPAKARAQTQTEEAAAEVESERRRSGWFSVRRGFNFLRPAWAWGAGLAALTLLVVVGWLVFDNARPARQDTQTEARAERERQAQEAQRETENQRPTPPPPVDDSARSERERPAQEQAQREQQHLAEQQRAAAQNSSSPGAGSIASFILTPQVRGASQTQSISIRNRVEHVVMRLRLEPNEFTTYRVALLDETGAQTLWRSGRLKARGAANDKILDLNLRAQLLKPQTAYMLRVTNDAGEIVDDYPFRVLK